MGSGRSENDFLKSLERRRYRSYLRVGGGGGLMRRSFVCRFGGIRGTGGV